MAKVVAVIDYGMGNIHSVLKALQEVSPRYHRVILAHSPKVVDSSDYVVVPGVGAMRDCMKGLSTLGFIDGLEQCRLTKPILGICMGMQVLMKHSLEGGREAGLGWFDYTVERFTSPGLKIPHMGWNRVRQLQPHPLWAGIDDGAWFYHVHSYCVRSFRPEQCIGECEYGEPFATMVAHENVVGAQFHPEKSSDNGLRLLKNFLEWTP